MNKKRSQSHPVDEGTRPNARPVESYQLQAVITFSRAMDLNVGLEFCMMSFSKILFA